MWNIESKICKCIKRMKENMVLWERKTNIEDKNGCFKSVVIQIGEN